jgi:hypothetical protein
MVAPRRHAAFVIPSEAPALELLGANLLHHLAVASSRWNPGLPRSESHMGSTRSKGTEMSDGMVRRYASRFTAASDSPTSVST